MKHLPNDLIGHMGTGKVAGIHMIHADGYRFQSERFVVGEYVSIREEDGFHTYQVVAVGPV